MILVLIVGVVVVLLLIKWLSHWIRKPDRASDPGYRDGWFGRDEKVEEDDETIHPFSINVKDDVLTDLQRRLQATRLAEPVEDVKFLYGFNPDYLRVLVEYWKSEYDWRQQERFLNQYPHFLTTIEGIDVHFVHVVPEVADTQVKVIPLMIIHGWPGCFAEFYKVIPLLTIPRNDRNFVFEVIVPSIPGYGFSEAAHKPGLTSRATSRLFVKLMRRIGHNQFYVQGGDWGSNVAMNMARFYPEQILGLHLNMFLSVLGWLDLAKYLLIAIFPPLVSKEEYRLMHPMLKKLKSFYREGAYFMMQSTKPDTLGCALSDSPAGLAAYLLEKFSVATNLDYVKREDGGLTEKFNKDELITNCMIYWVTNSFPSAARFYKENLKDIGRFEKYPIEVPSTIAAFPHEVLMFPRMLVTSQLRKLVSYNIMPRGGHFAAMEEPKLLAEDIWTFVQTVQSKYY